MKHLLSCEFNIDMLALHRVTDATAEQRFGAIDFCRAQLGKPWSLMTDKPTSI